MSITTIILNKNNNPNKTIESLDVIAPEQIILGTFSPIKTTKNITLVELQQGTPYNIVLNQLLDLVKTDWVFYIKDNEKIINCNENMDSILSRKDNYGIQILQDDVLIKETRLWRKDSSIRFKNAVFEKLTGEPTRILDILVYQKKTNVDGLIDLWRKSQPLSIEACYYKAFSELSKRNFKNFKSLINDYLFKTNKNDIPGVMARYYLSLVNGLVDDNVKEAIQNITICLAENLLMAEFWCLLGDIFIKMEKFEEATIFYENAIYLGSRRNKLDFWPMHIPKYGDYPKTMIEKCKNILDSTKTWTKRHPNH